MPCEAPDHVELTAQTSLLDSSSIHIAPINDIEFDLNVLNKYFEVNALDETLEHRREEFKTRQEHLQKRKEAFHEREIALKERMMRSVEDISPCIDSQSIVC